MVHGTQDWGFGKQATVHVLSDDLAELAARLGSIDVFDRLGYVVWMDDFNRGVGSWRSAVDGTGAEVELTTSYPLWPPYCLKLTGGSDSSGYAEVIKYLAPPVVGKLGVEVAINFQSTFDKLLVEVEWNDTTQIHQARIWLNDTDQKIYYNDEDNVEQELDDLPKLYVSGRAYYNLKLVVDFETDYYTKLIFGAASYDLSDYQLYVSGDPPAPHVLITVRLYSRSGENDACHLDGVIITQNEI